MSLLSNKVNTQETGSVLVLALLTLLALALMGVGLSYVGTSQIEITQTQATQDSNLSAAETGIDVAVSWLKSQIGTEIPRKSELFKSKPLSYISTPGDAPTDSGASTRKLSSTTYSAQLDPISDIGGSATELGVGTEVGESGIYGGVSRNYYFRVTASGTQNTNAGTTTLEVILSITQ